LQTTKITILFIKHTHWIAIFPKKFVCGVIVEHAAAILLAAEAGPKYHFDSKKRLKKRSAGKII